MKFHIFKKENFQNQLQKIKEVRWKPILIPPEHGIWGFTIESALCNFFIFTQHLEKFYIIVLMFLTPFAKQTLKIWLQDVLAKRDFIRKKIALLINGIFLLIFVQIIILVYSKSLYPFWIWIGMGFLLGITVLVLEIVGFYQNLLVEIAGSFVPILLGISMNTIYEVNSDLLLYIVLTLGFRNITSILFSKFLLNILKNQINQTNLFINTIIISTIIGLLLYQFLFMSYFLIIGIFIYLSTMLMLFILIQNQKIQKPQVIGWSQIFIGITYTFFIILSIQ